MRMVDYFAAKALQGLIVNPETISEHVPITKRAYDLAFAMMRTREELGIVLALDMDEKLEGE